MPDPDTVERHGKPEIYQIGVVERNEWGETLIAGWKIDGYHTELPFTGWTAEELCEVAITGEALSTTKGDGDE